MPSERSGPASLGIAFGHVHVGHRAVHTATTLQCHAAGAGDIRAEGSERPAAWKSFFGGEENDGFLWMQWEYSGNIVGKCGDVSFIGAVSGKT